MRSRICSELSDEEKALWIQSGLAVSPLMGTCLLVNGHPGSFFLYPKVSGLDMDMLFFAPRC